MWKAQTFTISYNANGGNGAPESQTKTYSTNLTLSSTKPTRSGYTFQGWSTSATGSVAYNPGATYSANANLNLYAVWKEGDARGPIKYRYYQYYNGGWWDFYFTWENVETCSLEGITIGTSPYSWGPQKFHKNSNDKLAYFTIGTTDAPTYITITLPDGSWCKFMCDWDPGEDGADDDVTVQFFQYGP